MSPERAVGRAASVAAVADRVVPSAQADGGRLHSPYPRGRQVVFWRHGRTSWNAERRFQGQTDVELDDVGRSQARNAASMLAALSPDAIVSSDLLRASQTAAELSRVTGLPVRSDPRLRETNAGRWQGRTWASILEEWPELAARWRDGSLDVRPGGGETRVEVADRSAAAVLEGLEGLPEKGTLVVVTHGGSARVAMCRLLGLPDGSWDMLGGLSNCCWSVLAERYADPDGRFQLLEHNAGSLPQPVLVQEG